jgi:hypothetical protein
MDKDADALPGKDEVWFPGQILSMQPETQPFAMKEAANSMLRLGVFAADPSHDFTAA